MDAWNHGSCKDIDECAETNGTICSQVRIRNIGCPQISVLNNLPNIFPGERPFPPKFVVQIWFSLDPSKPSNQGTKIGRKWQKLPKISKIHSVMGVPTFAILLLSQESCENWTVQYIVGLFFFLSRPALTTLEDTTAVVPKDTT